MLSIKAICKSENNEEVVIIGFELEGYCLCMTKSGTIFNAKHEDLTIVDKAYMEACAKEIIDFEIADFLEKASARLDQIQSKHLTSIMLELQKYRSKIEQGTLIELPCIIVGNGAIDAFGKVRVPYYQVLWLDDFGMLKMWKSTDKVEAEKRLKELQE